MIVIIKNKAVKYTTCQRVVKCCGEKSGMEGHGEGGREASIVSRVVGKGHILRRHLLGKDLERSERLS